MNRLILKNYLDFIPRFLIKDLLDGSTQYYHDTYTLKVIAGGHEPDKLTYYSQNDIESYNPPG